VFIRSIIVLAVPDLAPAQRFYSDFGLEVQATAGALALKTCGHDQQWGIVVEGKRKQLHHLSFGCYPDDLAYLQEESARSTRSRCTAMPPRRLMPIPCRRQVSRRKAGS